VEVGAGATAVSSDNRDPVAGTSRIRKAEIVVAEAPGGGNAGLFVSTADYKGATTGANGGGAVRGVAAGATGTFKSSIDGVEYGYFKGGDYNNRAGGSGAGAGANGGKATGTHASGAAAVGGEGLVSDITGESLVYGSGGGAGEAYLKDELTAFPGFQGSDGGTRAGSGTKHDFSIVDEGGVVTTNFNYIAATAPAANSGGGGGGGGIASKNPLFCQGTGGADGIVVIRYVCDSVRRGVLISIR
jgi:hypothetical protein